MFSCESFEIFQNTFFTEHLRVTASEIVYHKQAGNIYSRYKIKHQGDCKLCITT